MEVEATGLGPRNNSNDVVDWWFIYRHPKTRKCTYIDPTTTLTSDGDAKAIEYTLLQLAAHKSDFGYMLYNDQPPPGAPELEWGMRSGHSKGVIAVNAAEKRALWLQHSVPRWPSQHEQAEFWKLPDQKEEHLHSQHLLCMRLDFDSLKEVAVALSYHVQPWTYVAEAWGAPPEHHILDGHDGDPLDWMKKMFGTELAGFMYNSSVPEPSCEDVFEAVITVGEAQLECKVMAKSWKTKEELEDTCESLWFMAAAADSDDDDDPAQGELLVLSHNRKNDKAGEGVEEWFRRKVKVVRHVEHQKVHCKVALWKHGLDQEGQEVFYACDLNHNQTQERRGGLVVRFPSSRVANFIRTEFAVAS